MKPNIQHNNTIMASCVVCTRLDATYRRTLTLTDIAITPLTRMHRVDKSDDDEKSNFLGSFIWFVLMGRSHYVLIGMCLSFRGNCHTPETTLGKDVDRTYFL